nr:ATP-binding cassette domain-containing protein [Lentilactobacillus kisonensis]
MGTIKIHNLSFRYDGMPSALFDQFSLNIDESWKLGLIGRNGRGKTTFLRLLLGQLAYQGQITANVKLRIFPKLLPIQERQPRLFYDRSLAWMKVNFGRFRLKWINCNLMMRYSTDRLSP